MAGQTASNVNHKSEEAQRVARALREIDEDRDLVKARIERERIVREAREKAQREEEAKKKRKEQEQEEKEYEELDLAIGRGGNVSQYMAASASNSADSSTARAGARRLDGREVEDEDEDDEMGEEEGRDEDESEEDDDDDGAFRRRSLQARSGVLMSDATPGASQSFNNGNSTQVQAPSHPLPQFGAQRGRGSPRNHQAGSRTDDRRNVISSTLRRGGPRAPSQAFGGSGNVLGGQASGGTAPSSEARTEDEEQDEDAELRRPLVGDGDGGQVLGSA